MQIRPATPDDAPAMSAMLEALIAAGKRTNPGDLDYTMANYVNRPDGILCSVAVEEDGSVLGLQSLSRAMEGNPYRTPEGWGIIGTHVAPTAARRGVGSQLFEASKQAALADGIENIEAFINMRNVEGQAYYESMGSRTYRVDGEAICKCYRVVRPLV